MRTLLILTTLLAGLAAQNDPITVSPLPVTQTPLPTPQPLANGIDPATVPATQPSTLTSTGEVMVRLENITKVRGLMPHFLTGVGLVTGVANTGSTDKATRQAVINFVNSHTLKVPIGDINGGNAVLVTLTASLPPFATEGREIEVQVQSPTDGTSLRGGTLVLGELLGVDNQRYVVAQGLVTVAGISAGGTNAQVKTNPSVSGIVKNGLVVRPYESSYFTEGGAIEIQLDNPNPGDALTITKAVRKELEGTPLTVSPVDGTLVRIQFPDQLRKAEEAITVLTRINDLVVPIRARSSVSIDQVTGVVIAGAGVVISPCVVGISDLTISVINDEEVSQPNAFSGGETTRTGRTHIEVKGEHSELKPLAGGVTVGDLLQNLRALGLTPAQLVTVFLELHRGGYLQAKLEVR